MMRFWLSVYVNLVWWGFVVFFDEDLGLMDCLEVIRVGYFWIYVGVGMKFCVVFFSVGKGV